MLPARGEAGDEGGDLVSTDEPPGDRARTPTPPHPWSPSHTDVLAQCDRLFQRARDAGVLRPDTDLVWARRVYYALIHEVADDRSDKADDVDELATLVADTLLRGIGRQDGSLSS